MAGKYQAYPEYKDSGVEWLGVIPSHWEMIRFKYRLAEKKKTSNPQLEAGAISFGRVLYKSSENLAPETRASYQEVLAGEFLINPLNMNYDLLSLRTALSDIDVVVSTGYIVARSDNQLVKRYVRWLLYQFDVAHMKTLGSGVRQTISFMDIGNSFFYEPTRLEQEKIADFLDHETAKIDTLIDKQQQLIQLLKEKRQAVISHAVTKGLNPNAPMRDSGVEWLGEVPEHWSVTRIKYFTLSFEQGWSPQCDSRPAENDEYGVLKVGCVNYGSFRPEENKALPKELAPQLQYSLKKGDLLISRANTKELVGSAAVIEHNYDNLILCDKLYRLRIVETINPQLVAYYLSLPIVRQQIEIEATGASHSMQNIGQSTIKEMPIAVPPVKEANELVLNINEQLSVFDELENKAVKGIELLQERRTALISAAVTGKIDVRHHACHPTGDLQTSKSTVHGDL